MTISLQQKFIQLISRNQMIIHKICKIYTDTSYDHDDLFQEIIIQLWRAFPKFREECKISTWIYRIGLNTALALFKKKSKSITIEDVENIEQLNIINENYDSENARIQEMYQSIRQLSNIEKALVMMYLDNKPYKEIGEILGITEGNARVKMNRAKEKLKLLIKKHS